MGFLPSTVSDGFLTDGRKSKMPGALASDFPERLKRVCLESHHRYHPQAFVCGGFCDHRHCKGQRYCCYVLLGFWRSHFCSTTGGTFCLEDVHLKGNRKVIFVHAMLYCLNKSFLKREKPQNRPWNSNISLVRLQGFKANQLLCQSRWDSQSS